MPRDIVRSPTYSPFRPRVSPLSLSASTCPSTNAAIRQPAHGRPVLDVKMLTRIVSVIAFA